MTAKPQPDRQQAPVVQRVRVRYGKRGPLRFTSHRDVARALERAIRRARIPIAYSQGFTPHPKISYASAAPTGVASDAEYLELGLQAPMDPAALVTALDTALPPGLDVLEAVVTAGGTSLADAMAASRWRIELPAVAPAELAVAVAAFLAASEVPVDRLTKQGRRVVDIRPAVTMLTSTSAPTGVSEVPYAILDCVVRQVSPTVRPDDVLSGLGVVADLALPVPARATRLAQGPLTAQGEIVDPLEADRGGKPTTTVG